MQGYVVAAKSEEMNVTAPAPDQVPLDALTLLREQNHRINNDFASAINILSIGAVLADEPEVKAALGKVVELLHQYADVHRALAIPERDVLVDATEYLRRLAFAIDRSKLDRLNIHLVLAADRLLLDAERCWRLALIVHELVTNSARHASFDNRSPEIRIELSRARSIVHCRVADNGSGAKLKPGYGLKIVTQLAQSLGGLLKSEFDRESSSLVVHFPLSEREQRANHVNSRNGRKKRRLRTNPLVSSSLPTPVTGSNSRPPQLQAH